MTAPEPEVPSAASFFLRSPLYEFFPFERSDLKTVKGTVYFAGTMDAYCVLCGKHSVFGRNGGAPGANFDLNDLLKPGEYDVRFICSRNAYHTLWFKIKIRVFQRDESPRDCRRLHTVRGWSHAQTVHIFA